MSSFGSFPVELRCPSEHLPLVWQSRTWLTCSSGHRSRRRVDLYKHLVGKLDSYPIPELRLPRSNGGTILDAGCNWGRWSIAAGQEGYRAIGIDPSLGAVLAAKRLAKRFSLENSYRCGDARYLPFGDNSFDNVFSYSVLQHFSKADALAAFGEAARVLKSNGRLLVQLAHVVGVRSALFLRIRA